MAEPLMMQDLENATTTVRTANNNGYPTEDATWSIGIKGGPMMTEHNFGVIHLDNNQEFFQDVYSTDPAVFVKFEMSAIIIPMSIPAGNIVVLTYDGSQKLVVYLPEMTVAVGYPLLLYVASDGSTYYDEGLIQLAQGLPAFHTEASMVLRQHTELEASAVLKQWIELLASTTLRLFGREELEATCFLRQLSPEIPVGLTTLDMKKGDSVLLDWDENIELNILYYKVYKRTEGGEWEYAGQTKKPPFQVGGLLKDTEYWFAITAVAVKSIEEFLPNVVYNNNDQVVRSIAEEIVEIEEA